MTEPHGGESASDNETANPENHPAPGGRSSSIKLRPSPELAAEFPALNRALVFLGKQAIQRSAPAHPVKHARRGPARKSRASAPAPRKSRRFIAIPPENLPAIERHRRKCAICNHPQREAIEDLFVHWHRPDCVAGEYTVSETSLYRHAHATGLLRTRRRNLRCVLEHMLEQGPTMQITSDSIVRAVRAYACLTNDNRWIEPTKRVVVTTVPPAGSRGRQKRRRPHAKRARSGGNSRSRRKS